MSRDHFCPQGCQRRLETILVVTVWEGTTKCPITYRTAQNVTGTEVKGPSQVLAQLCGCQRQWDQLWPAAHIHLPLGRSTRTWRRSVAACGMTSRSISSERPACCRTTRSWRRRTSACRSRCLCSGRTRQVFGLQPLPLASRVCGLQAVPCLLSHRQAQGHTAHCCGLRGVGPGPGFSWTMRMRSLPVVLADCWPGQGVPVSKSGTKIQKVMERRHPNPRRRGVQAPLSHSSLPAPLSVCGPGP